MREKAEEPHFVTVSSVPERYLRNVPQPQSRENCSSAELLSSEHRLHHSLEVAESEDALWCGWANLIASCCPRSSFPGQPWTLPPLTPEWAGLGTAASRKATLQIKKEKEFSAVLSALTSLRLGHLTTGVSGRDGRHTTTLLGCIPHLQHLRWVKFRVIFAAVFLWGCPSGLWFLADRSAEVPRVLMWTVGIQQGPCEIFSPGDVAVVSSRLLPMDIRTRAASPAGDPPAVSSTDSSCWIFACDASLSTRVVLSMPDMFREEREVLLHCYYWNIPLIQCVRPLLLLFSHSGLCPHWWHWIYLLFSKLRLAILTIF